MKTIPRSQRSGEPPAPARRLRVRGCVAAFLLAISPVLSACSPEEIEMSVEGIAVSFEEGGVERGLASAIFVVQMAIPVIGMRLGSGME